MLAVLACILDEPRTFTKSIGRNSFGPYLDHSSQGYRSSANDYYPSEEVARDHFRSFLPLESSILVDSQKTLSGSHSANSSIGPVSDVFTSEAPPSHHKTSRTSPEHRKPQSTSLSTSPEHYRHTHRSNSNLGALAASFSRPFSFGSAASSPPNSYPKKRSSPIGSYLGNPAPTVTWSASGLFGRSSTVTEDPKSSSLSISDIEEDIVSVTKKPVFKTKLKNQDQFLNDGYANVPLLDPSKEWRYRAYREAYAHLLYIWGMPIASAEILNHNRPQPDTTTEFKFAPKATAPFGAIAGANLLNSGYNTENSNPVFRDYCPSCSTLLLPSQTPSRRCQACSKLPPAPLCLLCNTSIRGLSSPCSNCGHVLHASCRQLLSQASLDECPSGCGCFCAEYITMPLPPSVAESEPTGEEDQSKDASRAGSPVVTVTGDGGANQQEQLGRNEQGWEAVAFESLSRDLERRSEDRGRGRKMSK